MSDFLQSGKTRRSLVSPMLFAALDPALQVHLTRGAPIRNYANGDIVQRRGDKGDAFWLVVEGAVAVGHFHEDDGFHPLVRLGPGDSHGELAVFSGRPVLFDAIAQEPSRLKMIAARPFLDALVNYPASTRALLAALARQLQDSLDLSAGLRRSTNPARMAGLLATMADGDADSALVATTQQELAGLLGITRATANSALRDLQQRGLIERHYAAIAIPDCERLAQFAMA